MYSSCSPINAYQIQQRNFVDEIFTDDKLTAKTVKIASLENLYAYGNFARLYTSNIVNKYFYMCLLIKSAISQNVEGENQIIR